MPSLTFLVQHTVRRQIQLDDDEWDDALVRERSIARERIRDGIISGIWRIPGTAANWALWHVGSAEELHELLTTLPLARWSTFDVHLLADHPLMTAETS
ncbi:muconolactone Delta-isomerase family protein [Mycobacteroides chelonae]|uniref:Muconolactone delta-isomerase n=1 Tax=Mycobacteroides chelonae TaxID=1774 RepID=A0AB73TW11_MYCCH|nr:muconolactone Delta-isomerase family protein [Mycobacteroides chelonae]MBF9352755.1 muconolactone delta-isomerase [Mycobacteroides chelonae]MEC4841282.1 muconolactone Delta-isomerase family protein [Mycobacteroides chelonae]MEC4845677.1 muconolactone Delta-isomerase family protein [Mycobacteroides chelonae]MEC4854767.1 muconolactone Delta-isomerase family protein [Mycobacteroides chelonae]MEC4869371.1 muconolactone Delta-isomerase family protein [Mycobacteroides chelonae]